MYKISFDKIPWESPIKGMRHKKNVIDGRIIRIVEYSKEMPSHWCEKGHIGYVIEGQIEIQFEKETHQYRAGDSIYIPDGAEHKHSGKALTDTVKVFFIES
jgi:ethanolamine utilization protein EutQ (cupin superfamily)